MHISRETLTYVLFLMHNTIILCDWICKNHPYWHNNWNPICSLKLKLHSSTVQAHQAYGYGWASLLSQMAFLEPVKPWWCTTGPMEPVNGINKDVCGAKLHQRLSQPILWIETICVTYWTHSTAVCVLVEALTCIRLPTFSHHLPTPYMWHSRYSSRCKKSRLKSSDVS